MISALLTLLIWFVILWLVWYAAQLFGVPAVPLKILGLVLFILFLLIALRLFHFIPSLIS